MAYTVVESMTQTARITIYHSIRYFVVNTIRGIIGRLFLYHLSDLFLVLFGCYRSVSLSNQASETPFNSALYSTSPQA